ncbi:hypothetical protein [Noviherbaspirillum pedocola]|uniref:Uncharacterized protein n=1 Tax=Noviherbaspirillum pedocola TaxID=2801341 RepID=A0A934W8R8_9BURK|nr:hypothetical protein [Noviherbaspirillum pedocola]MBK4736149.1 hypothetical protein [Noviherbaspirillum pedocola]
MSSKKIVAVATASLVVAVASLGFAAYEAQRAGELAEIAAEAQINADATQRQYLASLDYRISRLEEGGQGDDGQGDDAANGQGGDAAPVYQDGSLQATRHDAHHRLDRKRLHARTRAVAFARHSHKPPRQPGVHRTS